MARPIQTYGTADLREQYKSFVQGGAFILPFQILVSELSLASSGRTVADAFLFVASDTSIDAAYFLFDTTSSNRGTMLLSLVTSFEDGFYREIAAPVTVTTPTRQPTTMEIQSGNLAYGRPVYLRVETRAESGITPWWTVINRIQGSFHMQNLV